MYEYVQRVFYFVAVKLSGFVLKTIKLKAHTVLCVTKKMRSYFIAKIIKDLVLNTVFY